MIGALVPLVRACWAVVCVIVAISSTSIVRSTVPVAQIAADGVLGQHIDFDNSRPDRGPTINLSATLRPSGAPPGRRLAPLDRQVFVKVSYAFQR